MREALSVREAWLQKMSPARSLVVGVPGKKIRDVSEVQAAELIEHAHKYEQLAKVHAGRGKDLGFV